MNFRVAEKSGYKPANTAIDSISSTNTESEEGLCLQGEEAFQTHSFTDADPQPVIAQNRKKISEYPLCSRDQALLILVYLVLHGN